MKTFAAFSATLLPLVVLGAGLRCLAAGESFWIQRRVTRTSTHEGIEAKIAGLACGRSTAAETAAILGPPDDVVSDASVEGWVYVEEGREDFRECFLGLYTIREGSARFSCLHPLSFADGILAQRTGYPDPLPLGSAGWRAGKFSKRHRDRLAALSCINRGHEDAFDAVDSIVTGESRADELDRRFGPPAERYVRDDLEARYYRLEGSSGLSQLGRPITGAPWSLEFVVVLRDGLVIDAPYDRSATDELIERFLDFRSWDRR